MLKKLINQSEGSQVEMNDSALRDIIPSNDLVNPKKPRQKRVSKICKILLLIFILGVIAIGIVLLALILTFSGKSFMNYIINSSDEYSLPLSNKTRVLTGHKENLTTTINERNWTKITIVPTRNNQQVHIPLSTIKTKQEKMNTQSMKDTIQTTQENRITTADIPIQQIQDYEMAATKKIPLTTQIVLQSLTNENKKQTILAKYKKFEEDDVINDLLFS